MRPSPQFEPPRSSGHVIATLVGKAPSGQIHHYDGMNAPVDLDQRRPTVFID